MPDIYVAFEAKLSDKAREALESLGWRLYENAIGEEESPSVTRWRHLVRVPEKDADDVHNLITDALGHEPANPLVYYDVEGTADRLGVHRETVKRRVARGELTADRRGSGPTAGLLLRKGTIDRLAQVEAINRRGFVGGYGPAGRKAAVEAAARHSGLTEDETAAELRRLAERDRREELLAHAEREMHADPGVRQRLEQLDEEAREEAEARELAARVRRAERIQKRAREILDEEGDDE